MIVAVAMSGGVDSTVAASMLANAGHEVIGITFLTGFSPDSGEHAIQRASSAAASLGIRHHVVDFSEVFRRLVIDQCAATYAIGRTPNPCVICNPVLKFGVLLQKARDLGADRLATGHYARIVTTVDGGPALAKAVDQTKDQSYFLHRVGRDALGQVLFPLGSMHKSDVKIMAAALGLQCADDAESQDICFAPKDRELYQVLRDITGIRGPTGHILSTTGEVLGEHDGIDAFTIGQRRGVGVALGTRAWITRIRPEGDVVLSVEPPDLDGTVVHVTDAVFNQSVFDDYVAAAGDPAHALTAKVRYAQKALPCLLTRSSDTEFTVEFQQNVRAITPGQAAVVYSGDVVLAGGWIA
jgi:tRNA-specific 2-thiouridylase